LGKNGPARSSMNEGMNGEKPKMSLVHGLIVLGQYGIIGHVKA